MTVAVLREMSRLETIFVHVPVIATDQISGGQIDPTGDVVVMTFTNDRALPDTPTWVAADWASVPRPDGTLKYYARALVGPAGVTTLAVAPRWWAHALVTDNPQIPICTSTRSFRVL